MAQIYKIGSKVPKGSKEQERLERIERLLGDKRIVRGTAITFTAKACAEATQRAKETNQ